MNPIKTRQGNPYPLGATWTGAGVNFALFAEHASSVDLCLFDQADAAQEYARVPLLEQTDNIWHVFLPQARPGQLYGYRVFGPYEVERGLRFNNAKLLLDPYAKAITGEVKWTEEMFGYVLGEPGEDGAADFRDNAFGMPKCVVIDDAFDWQGDRRPEIPIHESVIYEVHPKGFTQLHAKVPKNLRGTYAGMASEPVLKYLRTLGVTTVELLPVHHHINDKILIDKGLTNYWGYNTIGFFAPHAAYCSAGVAGEQVAEFKTMVRNFHDAGIEVLLDVVYNHTAEGNHLGPTLSFRGIDNLVYYRLVAETPRFYMDFTGTGNSLDTLLPPTLQLVMDSLRYWVTEMHVDGFRFDLATTMARARHGFSTTHPFFEAVHQDPVLSRVKLIAEPWDVGDGGYQVGNFPIRWSEWNGKYRDCLRGYWKGDEGKIGELAYRLLGSPDLFQDDGRRPPASINFVTSHDGFTLNDLVSYNDKHNEANGENNADGDNHNQSWNCGAEGLTADAKINSLRRKQRRNFLTTLLLSQGVPMLTAGDEFGRTQNGNNNAYCQDSEISWLHWEWNDDQKRLFEFTRKLIKFRQDHPVFRRPKYFRAVRATDPEIKDVLWFNVGGNFVSDGEWNSSFMRSMAMLIRGETGDVLDSENQAVRDDSFLLLLNAHYEPLPVMLPGAEGVEWEQLLDTALEDGFLKRTKKFDSGEDAKVAARSASLFRLSKGSCDQACQESWKKRPADAPAELTADEERAEGKART